MKGALRLEMKAMMNCCFKISKDSFGGCPMCESGLLHGLGEFVDSNQDVSPCNSKIYWRLSTICLQTAAYVAAVSFERQYGS